MNQHSEEYEQPLYRSQPFRHYEVLYVPRHDLSTWICGVLP